MISLALTGRVTSAASFLRRLQQKSDDGCCIAPSRSYDTTFSSSTSDDKEGVEVAVVEEEDMISIEATIIYNLGSSDDSDISYATHGDISLDGLKNFGLGPQISLDNQTHELPKTFKRPENLDHAITMDLPVGYYRLRRAMLDSSYDFWDNVILNEGLKYSR